MAKRKKTKRATIKRGDKLKGMIAAEKAQSNHDYQNRLREAELQARAKAEGKTVAQLIVEGWQ